MSEYAIYGLTDPRDEKIRYIGISNNVMRRYTEHTRIIDVCTPKGAWIIELYGLNLYPYLTILGVAEDESRAREKEKHFIERYSQNNLLNFIHNTANLDCGTRIDDPDLSAFVQAELMEGREP